MFFKGNIIDIEKKIHDILYSTPSFEKGDLSLKVTKILKKRESLLEFAKTQPSPCYIIDNDALEKSIKDFSYAFKKEIPTIQPYYALKSNPHPYIVKQVISHGFGLDVSSGYELQLALEMNAEKIIFTGPGKTKEELQLAIEHSEKVIIDVDSFSELEKINVLTKEHKKKIRVGVRVFSRSQGKWSKFGIPIEELKVFWDKANECPYIDLHGIQFHMSFNNTTNTFLQMFKELAQYIQTDFSHEERKKITFIDFGGGFISYKSKAFYPSATIRGSLISGANRYFYKDTEFSEKYYIDSALPLETYAKEIHEGIEKYLTPLLSPTYYCEPGRIISDNAMHTLLQVVDVKTKDTAILNGGTNIIGWNIYNGSYFPIVNLTRPGITEIPFTLFGCLCTPNDVWGKYCYAKEIQEDDILVVPYHGGYTYAFAQNFIKPIPPVYVLK